MQVAAIEQALARAGLRARGGFHPRIDDDVPPLPDARPVQTVVLAGNVGDSAWQRYRQALRDETGPLSLDEWTERVLTVIARQLQAQPLFPFSGPPYLPFQRWARRAEAVAPSPIGLLIHPEFGLWHAYRGALAFAERIELPAPAARASPCARCATRPCLSSCPVGALTPGRFDVSACLAHIGSEAGRACLFEGCLARRACPIGTRFQYPPEQAHFHQQAFLRKPRQAVIGGS